MRAPHARLLPLTLLLALAACRPGGEPAPAGDAATEPAPPSATEPAPAAAPASIVASFRCDDLLVGTTFDNVAGNVTLSINGSRRQLPQAVQVWATRASSRPRAGLKEAGGARGPAPVSGLVTG